MAYVSFDGLVDRFEGQIYQTRKGRLRMHLIDALYKRYVPLNAFLGETILDAAGGLGQMSHWFLENQADVHYFDVSHQMVEQIQHQFPAHVQSGRLIVEQASITDFKPVDTYSFVNVHAVLEWLEDPMSLLPAISQWVKPGGYLGLMVYNKHMLMLRHMMRGTLNRAMSGEIRGDKKGLTPISPLDPLEVCRQLELLGFEVKTQAGIRSFSDLTEQTVLDWYSEQEVFDAEMSLCEQRPYCDLARYVLFIAQKQS